MPIITVASTKGGVGKSTFILNLATALLKYRKKVALLDADTQASLIKWGKVRDFTIQSGDKIPPIFIAGVQGESLLQIAQDKQKQGYFVIIDSPGTDNENMRSALLRSDIIITPTSTSPIDLWEIESMISLTKNLSTIQKIKKPLILVFNKVKPSISNTPVEEAIEFLTKNHIFPEHTLKAFISDRVLFKNSIKLGKGVVECSSSSNKAYLEITRCVEELFTIMNSILTIP